MSRDKLIKQIQNMDLLIPFRFTMTIALLAAIIFLAGCKKEDPAPTPEIDLTDDFFNTYKNEPIILDLLENDLVEDNIIVEIGNPLEGTIKVLAPNQFEYTPNYGFVGTEVFSYKVCNIDQTVCKSSQITIAIKSVDDECSIQFDAVNDELNLAQNSKLIFSVSRILQNDLGCPTEIDQNLFTIESNPANGTLIHEGNYLYYTPDSSFIGLDDFSYKITSATNALKMSTARVILDVL